MKPSRLLSFIVSLLAVLAAFLPPHARSQIGIEQEDRIVAVVPYRDAAMLARLAERLDIWEVNHQRREIVALLSPTQIDFARGLGVEPAMDEARTMEFLQVRLLGISGYPCYRTVTETQTAMDSMAAAKPTLARVQNIGVSWDKQKAGGAAGHDIKVLVLGNSTNGTPKFRFFLMGAIHAREYTTAELALRFAEQLLNGYGTNPDATWLLDHAELHVVPMVNPDGRLFAEAGQSWRKNTNTDVGCPSLPGVDLNRNHTFKWGTGGSSTSPCDETYRGPSAGSEPEVQAIESYMRSIFADQRGPNDSDAAPADATGMMISLHSYSQLVLYPWGSTSSAAPNEAGLRTLGKKFGFFNRYDVTQSIGLYPTSGTTDDWAYGTLGVAAYTFELGTSFFQSCSTFESTIAPNNLPALLYAFKAARRPYQTPFGPEVTSVTATPASVYAGQPVTLAGTADDTRSFDSGGSGEAAQTISNVRASLRDPSWVTGSTLALPVTGSAATVRGFSGSISTAGLPLGKHLVHVEAQDASGNWGVPTAVFIEVLPDPNQAPVITLTSPANGAVIPLPNAVTLAANASDADGSIAKVEFYQGTTLLAEDTTAPYSFVWAAPPGTYSVTAVAQDDDGARTTSSTVNVTVTNQAPAIALTSPAPGTSITLPSPIVLTATATDADGGVLRVEFYDGATLLFTDTIAPFGYHYSAGPGGHSLTAVAQDNHGARTTSPTVTTTVINPPPVVALTTPVSGSVHEFPVNLTLQAAASDPDGSITRVEFRQNGTVISTDASEPYAAIWSPPIGNHNLTAVAEDNYGTRTTSATAAIQVINAIKDAPVVALSYPSNGQTLSEGTIQLTANASDPDGAVSKVEFFHGATKLGEDTTSPFALAWTGVVPGAYTLSVAATDNDGLTTVSTPVNVTVVANLPPVVAITSPAQGAGITGSSVTLQASAGDSDGSVVRVEFFAGTTRLGEDNQTPFDYLWNSLTGGLHTVTAVATDNKGATTTSSPVSFFVRTPATLTFQQGVGGYVGTVDTGLRGAAAASAYGSALTLSIDSDDATFQSQALVRFDGIIGTAAGLIPPGSLIDSATLGLQVFNSGSGLRAHRMLTAWSDASTWNTLGNGVQADGIEAAVSASGSLGADNGSANVPTGARAVTVTSAVQAWADGSTNHGFVLLPFPSGTDGVEFYTKEWSSAAQRPKLTVTFTPPAPPLVTLTASDAAAGEHGSDGSLSFTVNRSGATTNALSVPLIASGSAAAGSDYSGFQSPVSIPAGNASATVTLQVMPDAAVEGNETVRLALGSSTAFLAATPSSAEAIITDRPLHGWLNAELPGTALRGPLDDADGDGEVNLMEYFKGTRPGDPSSFRPLAMSSVAGITARIRFPRGKNRPDVTGAVRWSHDLRGWHASGETQDGLTVTISYAVVSPVADDPETVEATATLSGPAAPNLARIFFLLEVSP